MNAAGTSVWLDKVYTSNNIDDLETSYDGWAEEYDKDVFHFGYTILTGVMTGMVSRYIKPGNMKILDAGCGTGIVGEAMALLGYKNITGIDLSQGMLKVSQKKGAYNELRQMKLGDPLDFADDSFDAMVSMGVFTEGHAPASSLVELVRVTKPGGYMVYSTRVDVAGVRDSFKEQEEALVKAGKWKLVEKSPSFQSLPLEEPEVLGVISVFQVV